MKQSPRTIGLHNVLTTWWVFFFIGFTASTFFLPHKKLVNPRAATGRGGEGTSSSPASVYNLLGLSCRHKCCQMSPIPRIPFTFKAFHLCISVHRQRTRLVQGSGINHPLLSSDKRGSKTSTATLSAKAQPKSKDQQYFSSLF